MLEKVARNRKEWLSRYFEEDALKSTCLTALRRVSDKGGQHSRDGN